MGMVIAGRWTADENIIEKGAYIRPASRYDAPLPDDVIGAIGTHPGRFHLIASLSCPWSHRVMLVRKIKGLDHVLPLHLAHGPRIEGYAVYGGAAWRVPGTGRDIVHLHQLYTLGDAEYTGRSTVPVLWDSARAKVVCNESAVLMAGLDALPGNGPDFTLRPIGKLREIAFLNDRLQTGLNNGVYRAGFAQSQEAYDAAVADVFETLDWLDAHLASRRYLLGAVISESDWRLFPTLIRFDAIYHVLHRCCRRRVADCPNLAAYLRDLYAWKGVAETVDLDAARAASYANDTATNPHGIVAVAPETDWNQPHGRDALGPARVALRDGSVADVDPVTLRVV